MGWRNSIHLGPREREKKGAHYCFFFGNGQIFLVSEAAADMYAPKKIFAVYKFHRLIWHLLLLFLSLFVCFVVLFESMVLWTTSQSSSSSRKLKYGDRRQLVARRDGYFGNCDLCTSIIYHRMQVTGNNNKNYILSV